MTSNFKKTFLTSPYPGHSQVGNASSLPTDEKMAPLTSPHAKSIVAIGGGKGGIGKTVLVSNLAVYLTWLNKKVIVVDMDLGGANLHTSLGVEPPSKTLSDYFSGRVNSLEDIVVDTPIKNLSLISGANDPLGIASQSYQGKSELLRDFAKLNADFILIDLGAGTSNNTLDFFLLANQKIILVTPEPTSIENAYRFIKAAVYRMVIAGCTSASSKEAIERMMTQQTSREIKTPKELILELQAEQSSQSEPLVSSLNRFRASLVVNQVRVKTEIEIGHSIEMICERYFGVRVSYVGYLPFDNVVWQSIKRRLPFLIHSPSSTITTQLGEIWRNVVKSAEIR